MARELSTREVMDAVEFVAALLGCTRAYRIGERVHVPLDRGWSVAISADDAGRLRIEGCVRGAPRCTVWTESRDRARLADLARDVRKMANGMNAAEELV